jgi:hypothetical protein
VITTSYIAKALGKGASHRSIISSIALTLILVFCIYTVGSYLKVTIYPIEHRIIYYKFFDVYLINKRTDQLIIAAGLSLWLGLSLRGKISRIAIPIIYGGIVLTTAAGNYDVLIDNIALMSIPIVMSVLLYDRFASKKILDVHQNILFINYVAILSTVAGLIGIIISLSPIFSIRLDSFYVRNYPYDIFLFLSSFSPLLILLLISGLPIKLFINEFITKILKIKNKKIDLFHSNGTTIKPKFKFIFLILFMLLSIAIALVPHHPAVNKDSQRIGVDTDYYVQWVNSLMHSHDYKEFLRQAFIIQSLGERPLTLIFLFTIAKITNANLFLITEHLPVILGPALVLVIYFLTRQLSSNDIASLFSSFLTAISFQPLIGIYAGFYANWFALIIGYLSFVFLFRSLKSPVDDNNKPNLIIFGALLVLLLFSHIYTWSILVIIAGIFLLTMLKLKRYSRRTIILLLLIILSCVVVDIFKTVAIGSAGGFEKDIEVAKATSMGPQQFAQRFSNLMITLYTYVGGQFSNFIIFGLGLYWLFRSNLADASSIFLIICLSVGLFPFLLGDYIVQVRVFYDIPFQIPAAIALSSIWRKTVIPVLPICIFLLNATFMAVSNFYLIPPS